MRRLVLPLLSFTGMAASVLGLRWTHSDVWFFFFVGALAVFAVSLGDVLKQKWGLGASVPAGVHALALVLFLFGAAAGISGIGNPAYSAEDLLFPPFIMAACVYAAYLVVWLRRRFL